MYLTIDHRENTATASVQSYVLSTGAPERVPVLVPDSTGFQGGGTLPITVDAGARSIAPPQAPFRTSIQILVTRRLRRPLEVVVQSDGDGFLARAVDFELYGFGASAPDAVAALRRDIESLYEDLSESDEFSPEWLAVKALLREIVIAP